LIDLVARSPALGTVYLGKRLADRVYAGKDKELVLFHPPPKNRANDYLMQHADTFGVALCHWLDDAQRNISGLTSGFFLILAHEFFG
jgi:hypothetical protein